MAMKCFFALITALITISCYNQPNQPGKPTVNAKSETPADQVWIIMTDSSLQQCDIKYVNEYGDEITIGLNGERIFSFPLSRFNVVGINNGGKIVQVPCFPGDTVHIDWGAANWKWKYQNRKITQYDTAYFKYAFRQYKANFDSVDVYMRLLQGPQLGTGTNTFALLKNNKHNEKYYISLEKHSKALCDAQLAELSQMLASGRISKAFGMMYQSIVTANYLDKLILCYTQTAQPQFLQTLAEKDYINDAYLSYDIGAYKSMLNNYVWSIAARNIPKQKTANAILVNYAILFDTCANYFSGPMLDYCRYYCLRQMDGSVAKDLFKAALTKFKSQTLDKAFVDYVDKRFPETQLNIRGILDEVMDEANKTIPLTSLLEAQKGKFLLVDIWASWCMPCRKAVQEAAPIYKRINPDKLKLLFLSIDEDLINWKKASQQEGLAKKGLSYRLTNPRNSGFLQKIQVSSIPRYLLLDEKGNILYNDYAGLTSNQFLNVLKRYKLLF
jgi:thiol-disulfide isomerase/thioredoxin